jgi:hypothetical protein
VVSKSEINPGHYLELMDRLYVLASTLHEHCLEHPLSEYDEEIYKAIETAIEATYDAYQLVGQKEEGYENENHTY